MNTFMDGIKTQKSKEKQPMQLQKGRPLTLVRDDCDKINTKSAAEEAVKLAAIAMSFNVRLRSSDMPPHMQAHALRCTRSLLDSSNPPATDVPPTTKAKTRPNPTHIARALKKEFDSSYGPAWHCVVGASFGSFVTHSPGGFVYFSMDSLSVLLFKTECRKSKGSVGESMLKKHGKRNESMNSPDATAKLQQSRYSQNVQAGAAFPLQPVVDHLLILSGEDSCNSTKMCPSALILRVDACN